MAKRAAKRKTDQIIGHGLIAAEAIASDLRKRLVGRMTRMHRRVSMEELLVMARDILEDVEPHLAATLAQSELAAWLSGAGEVSRRLPKSILSELSATLPSVFPSDPLDVTTIDVSSSLPKSTAFPAVKEAATELLSRRVLTRRDFDALTSRMKAKSFTTSRLATEKAISEVRDAALEAVSEGQTLREFRSSLESRIDTTPISPNHMETVYRTNVQTAFAIGQDAIARSPIMSVVFPYVAYYAIDDDRVRDEHLALEKLGIQGTNIYRADDPMWMLFRPPWSWNCRCTLSFMTAQQAANKGITEAQKVLRGEPFAPEHRLDFIAFRPPPGFVGPHYSAA